MKAKRIGFCFFSAIISVLPKCHIFEDISVDRDQRLRISFKTEWILKLEPSKIEICCSDLVSKFGVANSLELVNLK